VERVILARHGQSEASAASLVNGDPSRAIHLTEQGRAEARALGERLADEAIDVCAVTSFPRTRETADIAMADRAIPRLVITELDDPAAGELEGRPLSEFRDWFRANGPAARIPGGESRVETVRRYAAGFRTLLGRRERSILLVAHGLPITYALLAARDLELPLTLGSDQVEHATPFPLDASGIGRVIERLETWVAEREGSG
jgi:broad specificity phosphatase PhoE